VNSGSYAVFISLRQFSLVCITFGTCVSIFHIFKNYLYTLYPYIYIYIIIYLYILIYIMYMISIYLYPLVFRECYNFSVTACWAQGQAAKLPASEVDFFEHGTKGPSPNLATTCSEMQLTNCDVRHFEKNPRSFFFFVRGL
jgi:hypothetical protein